MTEMEQGQGQSNFAPAPVNNAPSTPAPSSNADAERSFKQSEVNDIVGRAKSEAVERYKRESSATSHNYQPPQHQQQYAPPPNQQQYAPPPQNNATSEIEVRRMAAEEAQRLRTEWVQESQRNAQEQDAQRIATEFFTKISAGKANLQDFDSVMADVDLRSIPYHVQLANMVENTAEVMYELAKNPSKIGSLQNLIDIDLRAGRQPKLALAEMKRLSDSLKENARGKSFKSPNEPLSQMRPSSAGTDNKGPLSIGDYKRKYKV